MLLYHQLFRSLFLALLGSIHLASFAQSPTEISGRVTDLEGAPLSSLNILIKEQDSTATIAYSIADTTGHFRISFQLATDSVFIKLTGLSIADTLIRLANRSQSVQISLDYRERTLQEVEVKGDSPIQQRGDTLRYDVSSFEKPADRAIGDVIRRMPGLSIKADGTIEYQGDPIEKFYIDGLDMLEGRYALAHRNLPTRSVKSVEVLENHQPVRLLDSLVHSNKASLNIRLAAGVTSTGQAEVAGGANQEEVLWEGNITPMVFAGKTQFLASLQSNNTGNRLGEQRRVFTKETIQENVPPSLDENRWLNIQQLSEPGFGDNRTLFNTSHLGTLNVLRKLNDKYQVKAYISLYDHRDRATGDSESIYFLPGDTVRITELINNQYQSSQLETQLSLLKNDKQDYLRNTLKFQLHENGQLGEAVLSDRSFRQRADLPLQTLSNQITWLRPIGKQFVTFRSLIDFTQSNQSLYADPTLLRSSEDSVTSATQQLIEKRTIVRNSASYSRYLGNIGWTGKTGFDYEQQNLSGGLIEELPGEETTSLPRFFNDLRRRHYQIYQNALLSYERQKWQLKLGLPIHYEWVVARDKLQQADLRTEALFFNPSLRINYQPYARWKSMLSFRSDGSFPLEENLHFGAILRDYRQEQTLASVVPRRRNHSATAYLSYRDPITSIFFNIRYSYRYQQSNVITQNRVLPNGLQTTFLLNQDNTGQTQQLVTQASKFLPKWGTTFRLDGQWQNKKTNQFINDQPGIIVNQSITISPSVDTDITNYLNVEYTNTFRRIQVTIGDQQADRINQLIQNAALYIFPAQKQLVRLSYDNYINWFETQRTQQAFLDVSYRYTFSKKDIDIKLQIENLLNTKHFSDYRADSFTIFQTTYQLRPRQYLIGVRFGF